MGKEFTRDVPIGNRVVQVTFEVDEVRWGNDGIGSYEFWGAKCYDAGHDYVEEFDIENLHVVTGSVERLPSPELREILLDYLYEDETLFEAVQEYEGERLSEAEAMWDREHEAFDTPEESIFDGYE